MPADDGANDANNQAFDESVTLAFMLAGLSHNPAGSKADREKLNNLHGSILKLIRASSIGLR